MLNSSMLAIAVARITVPVIGWRQLEKAASGWRNILSSVRYFRHVFRDGLIP